MPLVALALDAAHGDHLAREREHDGLVDLLAHDGEFHLGAGFTAHALDRIAQAHALDRRLVDFHDQIARLDAGTKGRGILDRRDDLDETVFHADLDAQAAEFSLGADLQLLIFFGVEIGRMRIEAAHHAANGFGDELLILHRLDVALLDCVVDLGERPQILERQGGRGVALGPGRQIEREQDAAHHRDHQQGNPTDPAPHSHHPEIVSAADPSQGIERLAIVPDFKV